MIPVKVRKKDKELNMIAPSIKEMVDIVEKIVIEYLGKEFDIKHKVNLSLGEKQHFANNPRSKKMYIQYKGIEKENNDSNAEIKNLYISGILHEIGHSYLKIDNSIRWAKESIISEGLANIFGLLLMDDVYKQMNKKSWLVINNYFEREKKWYLDLFKEKDILFYPLEITRHMYKTINKEILFKMIRMFNLKHKTYREFENILVVTLGEKYKDEFVKKINAFDLEEYGTKYNKKLK